MQRKSTMAFLMALPLIVLIALLVIYPALYSLHLATLNKSMERFVGLSNFTFLFKRETFWMVVQQSCIFAITAVIFKALIGFIVAHFVHNIPSKGQRKWRGMLLVPWVIPPAMSCLAWLWLFDPSYSAFNWIFALFGLGPVSWTGDANWARFSVILINIWIGAPFFMIMYLAALKSVPEQLYEAAEIDGANWWQRMWYVTLPMMRNIIAITALFSLIVTFANFDIVRIITAGGPIDTDARVRHLVVLARHSGRRHPARRLRIAVHGADPGDCRHLHPARHHSPGERGLMAVADNRNQQDRRLPPQIRQHEPRPHLGVALVLFLPGAVRHLLPAAADLHGDHVAQDQPRDLGRHQSLVGATIPRWRTTRGCSRRLNT